MIYRLNEDLQITEFGSQWVEYICCNYVPDGSLIIPNGVLTPNDPYRGTPNGALLEQINNSSDIVCVIFDDSGNPIDAEQRIIEIAECGLTKPFYILTGLFKYYNNPPQDPRIKFFPFWTVWSSQPHSISMDFEHHEFSNHAKKYSVSCLNGSEWNHRRLTYLYLKQRDYFDKLIFSFGHRGVGEDFMNDIQLSSAEVTAFSQLPQSVEFMESDATRGIDITCSHPAYLLTYVNLVTETNVRASTPMLSEKTFKPIVTGQLFVLIAAKGAVQYLRDIGFDTFDDLIDHSYDNITDHRTRI